MEIVVFTAAIGFLLFCEAFFAGSEMGIVSVNKIRLKHLAEEGDKRARIAINMLENPERLLGTTLVGVNLAIVAASSLATRLFSIQGFRSPQFVASAVMLPLVVVVGELVPKVIFRNHSERLTLLLIYVLRGSYFVLFPFVALCSGIGKGFAVLAGTKRNEEENPYVTREELHLMIRESAAQGGPSQHLMEMAHQTFYFGETAARNVMIPLIEVKAVPTDANLDEIRQLVVDSGFSHIPVYEDRIDHIVGVIEVIDLLNASETMRASDLMLEPLVVPETLPVGTLLDRLRETRVSVAILIDEYGGVSGIATTEDIVEEIVGEIRDEYDRELPLEIVVERDSLVVDGKVPISKLNEDFDLDIPKEGVETIAGFIVSLQETVPKSGMKIKYGRLEFEILDATFRAVQRIRIRRR